MLTATILDVTGFAPAIHGMRNPMNSWNRSDSYFDAEITDIGPNDLQLMQRLFAAGPEHRKYDRMINVYLDIAAPLYFWKEFDTYKIGTVANSCSTMHKLTARDLTTDDFSFEYVPQETQNAVVDALNKQLHEYKQTGSKPLWYALIQLLPSSYNQRRTVMLNYETAYRIIQQRSSHKLSEWHTLCDTLKSLPYFSEVTGL